MELDSLAEWFSGIGALCAVIVAMAVATKDSRIRDKAEKRCQAEHISAWPVYFGLRGKKSLFLLRTTHHFLYTI